MAGELYIRSFSQGLMILDLRSALLGGTPDPLRFVGCSVACFATFLVCGLSLAQKVYVYIHIYIYT